MTHGGTDVRGTILWLVVVTLALPIAEAQTATARPSIVLEPPTLEVRAGGSANVTAFFANPTSTPITWALGFSADRGAKLSFERWEVTVPAGERARVNATLHVGNATGELTAHVLAQETDASLRASGRTAKADIKASVAVHIVGAPAQKPVPAPAAAAIDAARASSTPAAEERDAASVAGLVVLAGAGVAALGAAAWASRREWWHLVVGPVAALYTRLRPSKLLDHPMRARLVDLVRERPGITFGELARALDAAPGQLTHHARMLEKGRIVVSSPDGQARRFYLIAEGRVAPVARLADRVLALVRASPRRASDVARELGVSRQALHYHVKQLAARGAIVTRQDGRDLWLEATAEPQAPSAHSRVART